MAQIRYNNVGDCVILVHGTHEPSLDEWDKYLEFLVKIRDREGALRILVYSNGGAPTAIQRNRLNAQFPVSYPVAVMTGSTVVRGVVTALNWFYSRPLRTFAPSKLDEAMKHLQVPQENWERVGQLLQRLRAEISSPG